jgi:hypothetical protein
MLLEKPQKKYAIAHLSKISRTKAKQYSMHSTRTYILLFAIFCMTGFAHAQLNPFSAQADISLNPTQPEPHQEVRLTLQTSFIDLNRADITWYVNGERAAEGVGLTRVRVRTGALGSEVRISASASEPGGITVVGERIVRPVVVDIVWEADSYTPILYRGRALPSSGTTIKAEVNAFFARADGTRIPRTELIYVWRHNNTIVQDASGAGKYAANIKLSPFTGNHTLSVEVSSRDNAFVGTASARIPVTTPYLALYEDNPVQGALLHSAIQGTRTFSEDEVTFAVVPFYSSIERLTDPSALFSWIVNGISAPVDITDPARLILSRGQTDISLANVEVQFSDETALLQDATRRWSLQFGGSGGASLEVGSSNPFAPRAQ